MTTVAVIFCVLIWPLSLCFVIRFYEKRLNYARDAKRLLKAVADNERAARVTAETLAGVR